MNNVPMVMKVQNTTKNVSERSFRSIAKVGAGTSVADDDVSMFFLRPVIRNFINCFFFPVI